MYTLLFKPLGVSALMVALLVLVSCAEPRQPAPVNQNYSDRPKPVGNRSMSQPNSQDNSSSYTYSDDS